MTTTAYDFNTHLPAGKIITCQGEVIADLKRENAELRQALGKAKAWLKLEGYKATSDGIRQIDAVLKP